MALKFYKGVGKGLKVKVRKFLRLTLTFVEVAGEDPSSIGLSMTDLHTIRKDLKQFWTRLREVWKKDDGSIKALFN